MFAMTSENHFRTCGKKKTEIVKTSLLAEHALNNKHSIESDETTVYS